MRELWPVLRDYKHNWLTAEMARQYCKNRRGYETWVLNGGPARKEERKIRQALKRQRQAEEDAA
jgi:hypothetical protein